MGPRNRLTLAAALMALDLVLAACGSNGSSGSNDSGASPNPNPSLSPGSVTGDPAAGSSVSGTSTGVLGNGSATLTSAVYVVAQSAGTITIGVTRIGTAGTTQASYATADGTAKAGTDYTATAGTISWSPGDASARTFAVPVSNAAAFSGSRAFSVSLTVNPGASATVITATVTIVGSLGSARLSMISRALPVYASSGTAGYATDADYNTLWRSSGAMPQTLAFDLSSLPASERQSILLAWYNDATYSYDHALTGYNGYNNPGAYTVEANAAPGGGAPPDSGWVTLASVSNNTLHSRQHVLSTAGYGWLRLNFSAVDGSSGSNDVAIDVDLFDASQGVDDGWLFVGDSITANCMDHTNTATAPADSFGNQVAALTGSNPPQENAGMPGWSTSSFLDLLPGWLQRFPGRYVTLNLGTNDAAGDVSPVTFYANLLALVQEVLAAGKVPVVPTIPYSTDPAHLSTVVSLNSQISTLYASVAGVLPGPDLYAFFQANPGALSADGIHPTDPGCVAYRAQWAEAAAVRVYGR